MYQNMYHFQWMGYIFCTPFIESASNNNIWAMLLTQAQYYLYYAIIRSNRTVAVKRTKKHILQQFHLWITSRPPGAPKSLFISKSDKEKPVFSKRGSTLLLDSLPDIFLQWWHNYSNNSISCCCILYVPQRELTISEKKKSSTWKTNTGDLQYPEECTILSNMGYKILCITGCVNLEHYRQCT